MLPRSVAFPRALVLVTPLSAFREYSRSNEEMHFSLCRSLLCFIRISTDLLFVCVCVFMALITALVLCARSQYIVMSVSVRRVDVVALLYNGYIG